jgi:hypothetical protein
MAVCVLHVFQPLGDKALSVCMQVDDTFRQHMDSKRRVLLCGTGQQRTELIYMYIKVGVITAQACCHCCAAAQ